MLTLRIRGCPAERVTTDHGPGASSPLRASGPRGPAEEGAAMSALPGTVRRIASWRVVAVAAALLAVGASAACTGSGVQWKPTPSATGPGDGTGSPGPTPPGASSLTV